MPYPVALAVAAASTVASTGLQMAAQDKQRSAVERTRRAEMLRQAEYQKQAQDVAGASIEASSRPEAEQQIQKGADTRQQAYQRITSAGAPAPTANRMVSTSSPTATANTQTSVLTAAWNRILGGAQSRLGGYQDWNLTQNVKNQRAGQKLGQISRNARGSLGALSGELQDASRAGDGLNTLAGALGAVGTVAGTYAATQPGAPAVNPGQGAVDLYDPAYLDYISRMG